jgi:hypothetical protein
MRNRKVDAMRRIVTLIGIFSTVAVIVGADPRRSLAQVGGGFGAPAGFGTPASQQINNPAVSPNLLLAQPGINPAVAFQTLIQPQLQLGNAVLGNQQQIGALQGGLGQPQAQPGGLFSPTPLLQTGHSTTFLNTLTYFPGLSPRNRGGSMQRQ